MPQPGEPYAEPFVCEAGECWRMVHAVGGQATQCNKAPAFTGRWFAASGKHWRRLWSCEWHLEGLMGIRQFGE